MRLLDVKLVVLLAMFVAVICVGTVQGGGLAKACCCTPGGSHECGYGSCYSYGNAEYQCQLNTGVGLTTPCHQCQA